MLQVGMGVLPREDSLAITCLHYGTQDCLGLAQCPLLHCISPKLASSQHTPHPNCVPVCAANVLMLETHTAFAEVKAPSHSSSVQSSSKHCAQSAAQYLQKNSCAYSGAELQETLFSLSQYPHCHVSPLSDVTYPLCVWPRGAVQQSSRAI